MASRHASRRTHYFIITLAVVPVLTRTSFGQSFSPIFPLPLSTTFPSHQRSYACSPAICIPYPIILPFSSPTHVFLLLLPYLPSISDSPSTLLLCHPPSPQFHIPSSTFPYTHLPTSNAIPISHRNRNLRTSKAPLRSQAQGTSLFTS